MLMRKKQAGEWLAGVSAGFLGSRIVARYDGFSFLVGCWLIKLG